MRRKLGKTDWFNFSEGSENVQRCLDRADRFVVL
jgi:hypothetical protein